MRHCLLSVFPVMIFLCGCGENGNGQDARDGETPDAPDANEARGDLETPADGAEDPLDAPAEETPPDCCPIDLTEDVMDQPPDEVPAAPDRFVGYGVVESWRSIDAGQLASLMSAAGLNLAEIEYVGVESGQGPWTNIDHAATVAFVEAMRAGGIWTLINIVNWNSPDQRARTDEEFQAELDFVIAAIGPDRVILQAVSEWDDSEGGKARRWAEMAASRWPGLKSWNEGARPESGPADHFLDWHPCSVGDLPSTAYAPASTFIVNTDCGRTIEDLDADRNLIPGYVEQVLRFGAHFHYYEAVGPDPNSIQPDVIEKIAQWKSAAGL